MRYLVPITRGMLAGLALAASSHLVAHASGQGKPPNVPPAARAAIAGQLRDPVSARFEEVQLRPGAVCGFVNAKNGMGGYAGRMLFVYVTAERAAFVLDPASTAGPNWAAKAIAAYERHCK